ncbi:hypothetical protein OROGR_025676 [Orobanche gracilis]
MSLMSAYGHDMEREYSANSLPKLGSRYPTEAGIFVSSLTAMVFISGLITVGVSLVSLLVALAVMLRSCENRNSGVVEMSDGYRNGYDYCRSYALHAELNGLGADSLPAICKDVDKLYVKQGQYRRDLNITVRMVEDFFSSFIPWYDGREIVMMDADDLAYTLLYRVDVGLLHDISRDADYLKHIFMRKLYLKLESSGYRLILFSRRPETLRNATMEHLTSFGCHGPSPLIMRKESEMQVEFQDFLSRQRIILQNDGLRIIAVISSQMDALNGPCLLGSRVFKLPTPLFRHIAEDLTESPNSEEQIITAKKY